MPLKQPPNRNRMVDGEGYAPQVWQLWFDSIRRITAYLKDDGSIEPVSLADADASNNSIYYSTTASKLVYKDSGGTVNNLY